MPPAGDNPEPKREEKREEKRKREGREKRGKKREKRKEGEEKRGGKKREKREKKNSSIRDRTEDLAVAAPGKLTAARSNQLSYRGSVTTQDKNKYIYHAYWAVATIITDQVAAHLAISMY